jgi:hypothetical protein
MHPSALDKFDEDNPCSAKRHAEELKDDLKKKKTNLYATSSDINSSSVLGLTQARVDALITDFVIEDLQSMSVIEQPAFIRLIQSLQPTKKLINRKALVISIEKRFAVMKEKLATDFESCPYFCTAADIWSAHNHSFIGITVH